MRLSMQVTYTVHVASVNVTSLLLSVFTDVPDVGP